jgi:hypothetical protein
MLYLMKVELTKENLDKYIKDLYKQHKTPTYTLNEKIKNYSDSMYGFYN